ncbi:MAG: hypothetical protein IIB09_03260 [Bacteroidetes bacterium]|nr:hypothetical protein [Bacteroidota bacterium]
MPQRSNRLRIHPAAIAIILLMLGGSAVVVYQVSGTGDLPWTDELPWAETDPFEGLDEVIRAQLVGDSTGYALLSGERIALHPQVAPFYSARAYAPAWTDYCTRHTGSAAPRNGRCWPRSGGLPRHGVAAARRNDAGRLNRLVGRSGFAAYSCRVCVGRRPLRPAR